MFKRAPEPNSQRSIKILIFKFFSHDEKTELIVY
jgi:hypothetical protein